MESAGNVVALLLFAENGAMRFTAKKGRANMRILI